jgi:hypothetical protein
MLCDLMAADAGEELANRVNLTKASSEALAYAVAKSFSLINVFEGFVQSFYPRDEEVEGSFWHTHLGQSNIGCPVCYHRSSSGRM